MSTNPAPLLERDPVCGMNVNPATAKHVHDHGGRNYYFCCTPCMDKFKADPAKYMDGSAPARPQVLVTLGASMQTLPRTTALGVAYVCPMCPEVRAGKPGPCPSCGMALEPEVPVASTRTEYTCPMHPEIVRPGPGSCPICGMALEPRTVTAVAEENPELRDMTRRFWVSVALTVPLLALAMMVMVVTGGGLGVHATSSTGLAPWIELVLATPVVLWGGWPFFQRGWASIVNRSTNMFTLIAMGTGVAYGYSVVATIFPQIFPAAMR